MAQALRPRLTEPKKSTETPPNITKGNEKYQTSRECIRRTIWAAFVVDCLLSGGKYRPQSFQAARLDLSMPMGEKDFTFETEPDESPSPLLRAAPNIFEGMTAARKPYDSDQSLSVIIRGLDIWSTLSQWICEGGRRLEAESVESSPWNESSVWSKMNKASNSWHSSMSEKLHYSPDNGNLQAHIVRNQGQPFVFINALFHLNQLFLRREYISFIPYRYSVPSGPIDPPLLVGQPPENWWAANSTALFASAKSIVNLLRAAQARGVDIKTVFVAFCVYSAAATLLYAQTWPFMAPDTEIPQQDLQWALAWLEDAGALWKIVQGLRQTLSTLSAIYNHVKSADASRFSHPGGHGLEALEDNINRLAEISETGASSGEHAAEILMDLARQRRDTGNPQRIEYDRSETENSGQQACTNYHCESEEFEANAFIDPELLASFMDGSMADMSQLPFESFY